MTGLTTRRDELQLFGEGVLPRAVLSSGRTEEEIYAFAEMNGLVLCMAEGWTRQLYFGKAEKLWLDELGFDRDVYRRLGEPDASFVQRLQVAADAVTPVAILAQVQALLTAAGVTSTPVQAIECARDCAYMGTTGLDSIQSFFADGTLGDNGDRMTVQSGCPNSFVVTIPVGDDGYVSAVYDLVRSKKAFGIAHYVEVQV